ncbi:MAG: XrtA/PEP-CTERM system amidotransferase [Rhodothalassiaceae bacterium]
MCGIAGLFHLREPRPVDRSLLEAMTDRLAHRGPDDSGYHVVPGTGLGHRRLSIIDLAGGHQPLFNEDGSVAVVYNGEIYNFAELADELVARGHRFRTRCDTEVIVHAWEEWGAAAVERFRGMFAFAIHDARSETLFLARDRLGIKPLYYTVTADGWLVFGSELKALLVHPGIARRIDPLAVEDFFALGYVPDPRSIYEGIRKLPPGHHLTLVRGRAAAEPRQYWDVTFAPDRGPADAGEAEAALREQLAEAVAVRLVADVPLGAFLSGGVDSSSVVAMMATTQETPVVTCSISFGEREYDESRYAAMVAERFATEHHNRRVDADDFEIIARLPRIYDEPFADSSALPTYRVCEEARRHVTVALSGDGGDEVFAGYRRYRWHAYEERVRRLLPQGVRGPLFGLLGRLYPKLDWAPRILRAKSTLEAIARNSAEGYFHSVSVLPDALRSALYSPHFRRQLQGYRTSELFREILAAAPAPDSLSQIQYLDFKTYLPGDILTKVDRASMAHSLEVRVPILDHHLVEWAGGIPPALKLHGREGKFVLKKAMESLLPHDILYRDKMGFAIPLATWLRGPLGDRLEHTVANGALPDCGIFDRGVLQRMVEQHRSGLRDFSAPLWALLMFAGFLEDVHGGRRQQAVVAPVGA